MKLWERFRSSLLPALRGLKRFGSLVTHLRFRIVCREVVEPRFDVWICYSFLSAGVEVAAGGGASGVTVPGLDKRVVVGTDVVDAGAGGVSAPGASCQWPCSTDHTFPGGAWPGGWGPGLNCC